MDHRTVSPFGVLVQQYLDTEDEMQKAKREMDKANAAVNAARQRAGRAIDVFNREDGKLARIHDALIATHAIDGNRDFTENKLIEVLANARKARENKIDVAGGLVDPRDGGKNDR